MLPLKEELRATAWWQGEDRKKDIDRALAEPGCMKLWVFLQLHARLMDSLVLAARGHNATPGFADRLQLLQQLVATAPWRLDPDLGLIPKTPFAAMQQQQRPIL